MTPRRRQAFRFLCAGLAAGLLAAGCASPLPAICYKKTGAHGLVLDERGVPLTNVAVEVMWGGFGMPFAVPVGDVVVRTNERGEWRFCKRKVSHFHVQVVAPPGYEEERLEGYQKGMVPGQEGRLLFRVNEGEMPKEPLVFRLKRVPESPPPAAGATP